VRSESGGTEGWPETVSWRVMHSGAMNDGTSEEHDELIGKETESNGLETDLLTGVSIQQFGLKCPKNTR